MQSALKNFIVVPLLKEDLLRPGHVYYNGYGKDLKSQEGASFSLWLQFNLFQKIRQKNTRIVRTGILRTTQNTWQNADG